MIRVRGGKGSKRSGAGLLRVIALSPVARRGFLRVGWLMLPCALGRGGRRAMKREGDGATPMAELRICEVLYRRDRGFRPRSGAPARPLRRTDGWCDDPDDRNYNKPVRLPYPASAEAMWRNDPLYDIVVILDYNQMPRMRGHGSAIFMHCAQTGYAPTAGCIALSPRHLRVILPQLSRRSIVRVVA